MALGLPVSAGTGEQMKRVRWLLALGAGVALLARPLEGQAVSPPSDYSDRAEMQEFNELAKRLLGLKFEPDVKTAAEANMIGMRSAGLLFSRRLDSRTFFIQNLKEGEGKSAGYFQGSEEVLSKRAHDILERLKIPRSEWGKEGTIQENTQTGRREPSGTVTLGPVTKGRRTLTLARQIEGLPVFASYLKLVLDRGGEIGFMELHWPEIPSNVVTEAHRLGYKVKGGWRPPELARARVESVEAGIIHSVAPGLLMDIYPAIRVIYAPTGEAVGVKPMQYFDRSGRPVPIPRQIDAPCPPTEERRKQEK